MIRYGLVLILLAVCASPASAQSDFFKNIKKKAVDVLDTVKDVKDTVTIGKEVMREADNVSDSVQYIDSYSPGPGEIRLMQTNLNRLGYEVGRPDGRMGRKTRTAIKQYQSRMGVNPDGSITYEVFQAIVSSTQPQIRGNSPGLTQAEWMQYQRMLNELGYNAGIPDGKPGKRTRSAVARYLSDYNISLSSGQDRSGFNSIRKTLNGDAAGTASLQTAGSESKNQSHSTAGKPSMFERMAMQFVLANQERIPPSTAAAMYGYAVKDLNAKTADCKPVAAIGNAIEARVALQELQNEFTTFLQNEPDRYSDKTYTVELKLRSAYEDYDFERNALIINGWRQLKTKVTAWDNRDQRKFTPCKAFLGLPVLAKMPTLNPVPVEFAFDFHNSVRSALPGKDGFAAGHQQVKEVMGYVPMASEDALPYLTRNRLDKKATARINFSFSPAQPFYAYDTLAEQKYKPGPRSHRTVVNSITYIDDKTGTELHTINFNTSASTLPDSVKPSSTAPVASTLASSTLTDSKLVDPALAGKPLAGNQGLVACNTADLGPDEYGNILVTKSARPYWENMPDGKQHSNIKDIPAIGEKLKNALEFLGSSTVVMLDKEVRDRGGNIIGERLVSAGLQEALSNCRVLQSFSVCEPSAGTTDWTACPAEETAPAQDVDYLSSASANASDVKKVPEVVKRSIAARVLDSWHATNEHVALYQYKHLPRTLDTSEKQKVFLTVAESIQSGESRFLREIESRRKRSRPVDNANRYSINQEHHFLAIESYIGTEYEDQFAQTILRQQLDQTFIAKLLGIVPSENTQHTVTLTFFEQNDSQQNMGDKFWLASKVELVEKFVDALARNLPERFFYAGLLRDIEIDPFELKLTSARGQSQTHLERVSLENAKVAANYPPEFTDKNIYKGAAIQQTRLPDSYYSARRELATLTDSVTVNYNIQSTILRVMHHLSDILQLRSSALQLASNDKVEIINQKLPVEKLKILSEFLQKSRGSLPFVVVANITGLKPTVDGRRVVMQVEPEDAYFYNGDSSQVLTTIYQSTDADDETLGLDLQAPAPQSVTDSSVVNAVTTVPLSEEASEVEERCGYGTLENIYFKCDCIAREFMKRREVSDIHANSLINEIYNDPETGCVNPEQIARTRYDKCMYDISFLQSELSDSERDTQCACVGNNVAQNFAEHPVLRSKLINSLTVNAMMACRNR